jgi:MFS family permease
MASQIAYGVVMDRYAFLAMGMGSAIQDVAVDGLPADILLEEEIDRVNGVMFGGQMVGIAIGTGLGGSLIAYQGVPAAALALAAILLAILGLVVALAGDDCGALCSHNHAAVGSSGTPQSCIRLTDPALRRDIGRTGQKPLERDEQFYEPAI